MISRQFLNYIIEKEKDNENEEIIHDYAKCDDDMFLYMFSTAMLNRMDGRQEDALAGFEQAERFLLQAEGNQFFSYRLFRKERMTLFEEMGRSERCQIERATLLQHEEINAQAARLLPMNLLQEIDLGEHPETCAVQEEVPQPTLILQLKQINRELILRSSREQSMKVSIFR